MIDTLMGYIDTIVRGFYAIVEAIKGLKDLF